ncbi:hypothetical protein D3C75_812830 [compost metagenome]
MPGMFCDVMVTRNSGSAIPSMALMEKVGEIHTGLESCQWISVSCNSPLRAQSSMPVARTSTMV